MRNPWKLTTLLFAGVLAASIGRGAVNTASAEPQPVMRTALDDLRAAAQALEHADRDKGGHRAKALELTRGAIAQVEAGMRFDNRH
jgi:hypothetical protein